MDCTAIGAPSPMAVPPTQTRFERRRGRGPTRSSGRFRSTLRRASTTSSVRSGTVSHVRLYVPCVSTILRSLVCAALLSCTVGPTPTPVETSGTALASSPSARVSDDDERCSRATFAHLLASVNAADEAGLRDLLRYASVTLPDRVNYSTDGAVTELLARSRAGERWTLVTLDINGRGWHGGIDFGVVIRRTAPDLGRSSIDAPGKGVLDCPDARFRLFGLGGP